jgi:hypothetical protein
MNGSELQKKHFSALREKYRVGLHKIASSDSFLYLILRKASLGIHVTDIELKWLAKNGLFTTIESISLEQYQTEDKKRLEADFLQLRTKYLIPQDLELLTSSSIYSILWKLDTEQTLVDSEVELLNQHNLVNTVKLIQDILEFERLKTDYGATDYPNRVPEEPIYSILKKLDTKHELSGLEVNWLIDHNFDKTLEFHWNQEEERKAELDFLNLKSKYQISHHPDTSASSLLYFILKKLKAKQDLEADECNWLKQQNLTRLVEIDQERKKKQAFIELKRKYKATEYQNPHPSDPLFDILKKLEICQTKFSVFFDYWATDINTSENQISEQDIRWLTEASLDATAAIAQQIHFRLLKAKYQLVGQLEADPFYEIMLKLEREVRLDPKQVIQLIEENRLSRHGKIAIAHYRLEAKFYEQEYQQTGNKWNLPSASSNWRKANEPENALKVIERVNLNKIQESDLKSALWVTRGAAFRDLDQLDKAENCATQAMECQPDSHQPYTLMGAICYDRREYADGDHWFEMAAERGADDADDEIERIVRMTKDKNKRREVAEYLLSKDPDRYAWANSYLK